MAGPESLPLARWSIAASIVACVALTTVAVDPPPGVPGVDDAAPPSAAPAPGSALPFDLPPTEVLRESPRKVFAHYFVPYPISIDNREPGADYYSTQYLEPEGESGKHREQGGLLRERPLPRPPIDAADWQDLDAEEEVRRAIGIGLDGFAADILASRGAAWEGIKRLLRAAQRVDPQFGIVTMPDMAAEFATSPDNLTNVLLALAAFPSSARLPDGRLIVAPYGAERQPAAWWRARIDDLAERGLNVALVPLLADWRRRAADYAPFSYGLSEWGRRWESGAEAGRLDPSLARHRGAIWMAPVAPQDFRPKSFVYWEASNTATYRAMWEAAIAGGADWVHVITWNDYGEATEIAPSTGTQYLFHDLTAYYLTWFKTGRAPTIRRDVLYYCHRNQATGAPYDTGRQARPFDLRGRDSARDEIELLAFLTAPGTLEIEIAGTSTTRLAPTGVTSFRVPLAAGRPVFRLRRNGVVVEQVESRWTIRERVVYQDLLYRGGSSSRPPVAGD